MKKQVTIKIEVDGNEDQATIMMKISSALRSSGYSVNSITFYGGDNIQDGTRSKDNRTVLNG